MNRLKSNLTGSFIPLKGLRLIVWIFAVSSLGSLLMPPHTASALSPYDYPDFLRNAIRSYDDGCPSNVNKYMLISWASPEAQPTTNVVTVPYGTKDVNLWFNTSVFTCRDLVNVDSRTYPAPLPNDGTQRPASHLRENRDFISNISVSPDGFFNPSPVGNTAVANYDANTRYWFGGPIFFVYHPGDMVNGLTSTRTITINLAFRGVNRFASGAYICTGNGATTTFANFTRDCPETVVPFTILINVQPPDACPNIAGYQGSVPPGYVKDGAGNCVPDYTHVIDVYPDRPQAYAGDTFSVFGDVRNTGSGASTFVEQSIFGDGNAFSSLTFLNPNGTYSPNRYVYWSQGGCPTGPGLCTRWELRFRVDPNLANTQYACFQGTVQPHRADNFGPYVDPYANNCIKLVAPRRPYFSTYGGDLHAGAVKAVSTAPVCTDLSSGSNKTITGRVFAGHGSRSQIALAATGLISAFGSNNSPVDSNLTFGNQAGDGYFGHTVCHPDYSQIAYTATVSGGNQNAANLANTYNGQVVFWSNPGVKHLSGGTIPAGKRVTIINEGQVVIDGNIDYGSDNPSYADRDSIPSFALISRGDVSVNQNVTRLHGLYVTNASLSTCSDTPGLPSPSIVDNSNTDCLNQLVVYGMVIANKVWFRRIIGDASAVAVSAPATDDQNNAAEIFRLPADFFLATPPGFGTPASKVRYKADLPPLF